MTDRAIPMGVEIAVGGWNATVVLSGEVDFAAAPELHAALDAAIESCGGDVALDMTAVAFLDSSALRVLLQTHKALAQQSRRLLISALSTNVARVIEVAGVDDVLKPATKETARQDSPTPTHRPHGR
jgi:anti-anti-sigma factor